MSFYDKYVLPRLLDLAMRNKEVTRYREQIVPQARGIVLEVGVGSGLNLPFYPKNIEQLYALDPSSELLRMTGSKITSAPFPVELVQQGAESLPLADHSVDTVLATFTVCSIADPLRALREMRRVLKPDGVLLFAEHGLAPDPGVQRWQHRLNPIWRSFSGGCNLDRRMDALITASGFRIVTMKNEYAKGPRPLSYMYAGSAQPANS